MNIKKKLLRTTMIVAAGLVTCFATPRAQGTTLYVGTCHAGGKATIGDALAVATPGTIIDVCPGTYAEQVTITLDNITLQGIPYTHEGVVTDAAVIIPPAGGLVGNGTTFSTDDSSSVAVAQIIVQNAEGVTISHITVDAQSTGNCGVGMLMGIYYQNSTGTVTDSVARNQIEGSGMGNQCGWGIAAESNGTGPAGASPALTVSNCSVHNFQKNGIVVRGNNTSGPDLTATGNTVVGIGATTVIGQNGIEVAFGASGSVKGNYVSSLNDTSDNSASGILFYSSTGSAVAETNIVENANTGIADENNTGTTINSNHIGGSQMLDGIDLCSTGATANSNFIYNSGNSGIHIDDGCGSGTSEIVKSNTINESCAGIMLGSSNTSTTAPNTYFNDGTETQSGDTCVPPNGPTNLVTRKSGGELTTKHVKPRP
jgi:hypothetical protein